MMIRILYGTETGNAEMLAEDIAASLVDHEVEVVNLADFAPLDFDAGAFYLMVCSTYGEGDLPASAQPFASAMNAAGMNLSGVHFAVFGLGYTEYDETFANGSQRLLDLMLAHGATLIGDRVVHDASGPDLAEDIALPWATRMVELASARLGEAA